MPYLKAGRKAELLTEPQRARTAGDYNFLFTNEYLKAFIANPSYETIAKIRKASLYPQNQAVDGVNRIDGILIVLGVSLYDRQVARDLAFLEFYERIGHKYEVRALTLNGDIENYEVALRTISEKPASAEVK